MKKVFLVAVAMGIVVVNSATVMATPIFVGVDAAPNVYAKDGSLIKAAYNTWAANAYSAAADGTFVNMANSINPNNVGTTNFEIQDEVVYSFGDLGKRLTWTYYLEGETIDNLTNADGSSRFQVSLFNTWDGEEEDYFDENYGSTWLTPTKWVNYDADNDGTTDGVIGMGGMAWWGAKNINTQEALNADILSWGAVAESWKFSARLYNADGSGSFDQATIVSNRDAVPAPVPEPATMLLFGTGLVGLAAVRRGKKA